MNDAQIALIGRLVVEAEQAGLIIIGGIKALVAMFHVAPTEAQMDATIDAVQADARRRRDERAKMGQIGTPTT